MYQRLTGNGFNPFIRQAEIKIMSAVLDYELDRHLSYSKDNIEENLQKANEAVFKAIQERDFFEDLQIRLYEQDEDF